MIGSCILVVEDNNINQELIVEMLARTGVEVEIANNGKEALEKLSTTLYAAVRMDVKMPVMDCLTASIKIREMDGEEKNIPIIALSAIDNGSDEEACLEAGMNDIVPKPIAPEKLIAVLKKWIGLKNQV